MRLGDDGKSLTWGFALRDIKTSSLLRINDKGEWTEVHDLAIGSQPPKRFMEITVRRQK